jgi:hypothetical protein
MVLDNENQYFASYKSIPIEWWKIQSIIDNQNLILLI